MFVQGGLFFLAERFATCEMSRMKSPVRTIDTLRPTEVARAVLVSVSHASEILSGRKTPSLTVAVKIERAFGIPPSAWLEPRTERAA